MDAWCLTWLSSAVTPRIVDLCNEWERRQDMFKGGCDSSATIIYFLGNGKRKPLFTTQPASVNWDLKSGKYEAWYAFCFQYLTSFFPFQSHPRSLPSTPRPRPTPRSVLSSVPTCLATPCVCAARRWAGGPRPGSPGGGTTPCSMTASGT